MNLSLLQLDHYSYEEISVQLVPGAEATLVNGYPSMDMATFGFEVEFHEIDSDSGPEDGIQRFGVGLTVKGEPKESGNPQFPYKFRIKATGIFNAPKLPDDKREVLVLVNGASMLYGAIRDQVMALSGRFQAPTLLLPAVKFDEIGAKFEAEKKREQAEPAE